MKLLIVRHGQTDWNKEERIQGRTDIELNQTGIAQAKQTAENLKKYPIDMIFTSPLKRAKKTAEIINEQVNSTVVVEERLKERCFGKIEGNHIEPQQADEIWDYTKNVDKDGMEAIHPLFTRIYEYLDFLKQEYRDKTILLVTHGGIVCPMRCYIEGRPSTGKEIREKGISNCQIIEYTL